jgi:hypothetical protein
VTTMMKMTMKENVRIYKGVLETGFWSIYRECRGEQ